MQLPEPGTYAAQLNGGIVIYETDKGALCAALPIKIDGWNGKHTMTIVKADGTVQQRTVQTLKDVFSWDGADPFWLSDNDLSACEFEIVGVHEDYDKDGETKTGFKIQWLNPVGGGGGTKMPEPADRKTVLAKFGAKLRALSGGKQVVPPKPAAKPAVPPAKPSSTFPPCTMTEAYAVCLANHDGNEQSAGVAWYAAMDSLFPGKNNSELTDADFGRLKAHLEK